MDNIKRKALLSLIRKPKKASSKNTRASVHAPQTQKPARAVTEQQQEGARDVVGLIGNGLLDNLKKNDENYYSEYFTLRR